MLSSSSPSLSVSLDSFYIFIFFQKAIHPLKFCIWRSARVTRIWNLSGVTFGSVSVPLSLEEEVSTMCRRGFWLYAASHSIDGWHSDFHKTFSSLCTSLLLFCFSPYFCIFHEKQYCSHNVLLQTHSKPADVRLSGRGTNYYFTVHSIGKGDAHYLFNTAIIGMGMFLQSCCLRLSNLISDTPTKALIYQKLQSIGRNGKLHMKFEAIFYLKSPITYNYEKTNNFQIKFQLVLSP